MATESNAVRKTGAGSSYTAKDFILLAVFGVVIFLFFMILSMVLSFSIDIAYWTHAIGGIVGGIAWVYVAARIPKKGAMAIMGLIMGIVAFLMGMMWTVAVGIVVGGIVAELVLIAGIVRYADIEEQLIKRKMSASKIGTGAIYFIIGLAKKAVLANTVGAVFEEIAEMPAGNLSILTAWLGVFSYAFQIYFDFSGYSDMAVGLGKMFGFDFKKNFDYPYVSKSVTEFWRRWHISLSTWFREYVYIPLGGNQCSVSRNIFNLMVVWTLTGMWHGAAWNFVAWGVYYGVILVLEKYVWGAMVDQLPDPVRHIYTGIIVLVGWVFFFSPSLGYAMRYLLAMIGGGAGIVDATGAFLLFTHWLLYLLAVLGSSSLGMKLIKTVIRAPRNQYVQLVLASVIFIGMFLVSTAFLVTGTFNPFLYFRF